MDATCNADLQLPGGYMLILKRTTRRILGFFFRCSAFHTPKKDWTHTPKGWTPG